MIMEPLLGGKLATGLPQAALNIFADAGTADAATPAGANTPAAWAFRWLWNQEEPTVVLSGMGSAAQVRENAALADAAFPGCLSAAELEVYKKVREVFNSSYKIHCTGCAYCTPCPRKVNIPGCFAAYNTSFSMGRYMGWQQYMTSAAFTSRRHFGPSNCVACGACEKHCPQKLPIIENLKDVRRRMEPFWFRAGIAAARKFLGYGGKSDGL
jgi:predicted aldo/keto reductase-like oxidoreductase